MPQPVLEHLLKAGRIGFFGWRDQPGERGESSQAGERIEKGQPADDLIVGYIQLVVVKAPRVEQTPFDSVVGAVPVDDVLVGRLEQVVSFRFLLWLSRLQLVVVDGGFVRAPAGRRQPELGHLPVDTGIRFQVVEELLGTAPVVECGLAATVGFGRA